MRWCSRLCYNMFFWEVLFSLFLFVRIMECSHGFYFLLISSHILKTLWTILIRFRIKFSTLFKWVSISTIVDKINVTLQQSPLSPHSMLINEWLRQREAEFSAKAPTTTNLQHWIGGKGGNGNIKCRFFAVTLGLVQDCSFTYISKFIFSNWLV